MKFQAQISCLLVLLFLLVAGCTEEDKTKKEEPEEKTKTTIATEVINYFDSEDFENVYEQLDDTVKAMTSAEQLESIWENLTKANGELVTIKQTRETEEAGFDVVYVTLDLSKVDIDARMVFNEDKKIIGLQFVPADQSGEYNPPSYSNTTLFTEEEITVGEGEWELPGTLTIPNGTGPFPAVVLVHGSGPNDRDETIGPNKPFKDLAWGLASKGIAVLRYEKRTKEHNQKIIEKFNFTVDEEVTEDAILAVDVLMQNEKINNNEIYLIGHSLGAMMAPRIANQDNRIKSIILMAPPAQHLEDLMVNQTIYIANLDGNISDAEQQQIDQYQQQRQKIKELNISADEYVLGSPLPYWEDLATYEPIKEAQKLNIPILILQGKRDYQVSIEDDFNEWNTTFNGEENITLNTYEKLNHLFIEGEGTPSNEEYLIPGNIDEQIIIDIYEWITKNNLPG